MGAPDKISSVFGKNVFTRRVMERYMGGVDYAEFEHFKKSGKLLSIQLADKVADAMKRWALDYGATHYTHWFQPLTGTSAGKHDSFLAMGKHGDICLEFSGKNLLKGETDASSFPSGGIRATFEARGYTVWDMNSPTFIKSDGGAVTLYIPTAFCSYNGEALDKKTPLLRSMQALEREGVRLLGLLGERVSTVFSQVGGEQEYFLIDKSDFESRTDLKFCGRTLFGNLPPKGQEQNDQYYGIIRKRVAAFMSDLNGELWSLGITAKTEHNEVAPTQHELAPIFTSANIATDQNQLIMDSMKKIAAEHGFACLLHEKPFAGINGSGKHNNWSIAADGVNLLSPGKTPKENRKFLLFFMAVIAAVDEYADLVRMSAATPGNDLRMGGNEAPPNIVSVYIGEDMERIVEDFMRGNVYGVDKQYLGGGISYLAEVYKDTSDRNRTSPFAFTGNKFEFRMVGASATLSNPNTVLNTAVASVLANISEQIEARQGETPVENVVDGIIKELYDKHKRVIFSGNNYSPEWKKEAKRRKLSNITNCVDAYETLLDKKSVALFERLGVYSETELKIRREIYLETYVKTVNTEALAMLSMSETEILPAVIKYQGELAACVRELYSATPLKTLVEVPYGKLIELSAVLADINKKTAELSLIRKKSDAGGGAFKRAVLFRNLVIPAMNALRAAVDDVERMLPRRLYPFPTYGDILFYKE